MIKSILVSLLLLASFQTYAQLDSAAVLDIEDDDLNVGGDIFTDFNEDIDASKVMEDERYYAHGRFFCFSIGLGMTSFGGNRGKAYENENPTFNIFFTFFQNFQTAFTLGLGFSKHHMFIAEPIEGAQGFSGADNQGPGFIEVNMLRVFFGHRYYFDTANLGTAITYSNPYLTGRLEYWYQTNKFIDQEIMNDISGGGFGFGAGVGLEFPLKLKESFLNLEMLLHTVNFYDKFTKFYRGINGVGGYDDMTGLGYSTTVNYVMNW